MLKRYEDFLKEFDKKISEYTNEQKPYLKCKKGCSDCCVGGDYPFSRLEMEYIMSGFLKLPEELKQQIRSNVSEIRDKNHYTCPFLIDNLCCLYDYRGIVCRTHGLAYLYKGVIKLPECANNGLNYSNVFNKNTHEIVIDNPIKESLRTDDILKSPLAEKYQLEAGDIRKLVDWFN